MLLAREMLLHGLHLSLSLSFSLARSTYIVLFCFVLPCFISCHHFLFSTAPAALLLLFESRFPFLAIVPRQVCADLSPPAVLLSFLPHGKKKKKKKTAFRPAPFCPFLDIVIIITRLHLFYHDILSAKPRPSTAEPRARQTQPVEDHQAASAQRHQRLGKRHSKDIHQRQPKYRIERHPQGQALARVPETSPQGEPDQPRLLGQLRGSEPPPYSVVGSSRGQLSRALEKVNPKLQQLQATSLHWSFMPPSKRLWRRHVVLGLVSAGWGGESMPPVVDLAVR